MHEIIKILKADNSYQPSNFKFENPDYHPDTPMYNTWWKAELKKCVEGFWFEGRFMPPQLYTYINQGVIERLDEANITSQRVTQPLLRDIEWLFFYNWLICRKFSGFEGDTKYSCNRYLLDPKFKREKASKYVIGAKGKLKEYIDPRDYLYMKHNNNYGIPLYENNASNLILLTGRGCGKLLEPDTKIRVKDGWKTMRDIEVMDKVYSSDGTLCNVIDKTPLQVNVNMYQITLQNGKKIKACEDHQWKVYDLKNGNMVRVKTTKQLFENNLIPRKSRKKEWSKMLYDSRFAIPLVKPVSQDTVVKTKLSPYLIGLLSTLEMKITYHFTLPNITRHALLEEIEKHLPKGYIIRPTKELFEYIIVHKTDKKKRFYSDYPEIYKLARYKQLSDEYKINGNHQVMREVLRGIFDRVNTATYDKYILKVKNKYLKNIIVELLDVLGLNYKITGRTYYDGRDKTKNYRYYKIVPYLDEKFNLKKEINDVKITHVVKSRLKYSTIKEIKPIGKGIGYCISVDSSDNTYVIDDYVVTHNSYWGMAAAIHEFIFNSVISYEQLIREIKSPNKTKVNCILTCELEDKAIDLINKIKTWYENMPGSYGDDDEYMPSPLYRAYTGTWSQKITQQVEKYYYTKDGNKAKRFDGSGSTLSVVTFNKDPYKTAGKRNSVTIVEEIGLCTNLITFWNANKDVQQVGRTKFGSTLGIGCVCAGTKVWTSNGRLVNIEDLKQEDGIIGYDGKKAVQQTINWFKEPAIKPCYRITTEGNNIIECSEDHPFISSSRATKSSFKGKKNILKGSYKEAKNLSVGDYLVVIDDVPVFGDVFQDNAYLTGLMLGDGYFKGSSLSVDDNNVKSYIESNYGTSIRKQFITKTGSTYTDLYIKGCKKDLFHESLIGLTRDKKRLPSNIHEYNKESLSLILAGIFDADGNVNVSTKGTRVVLTNISENLLKDVKYQLLKFGIHCSIYKENRNTKPSPGYEGQMDHIFRLYISKNLDVKKFKDNIPIKHSKKIESLSKFIHGNRDFGTANIVFKHTGECEDEKYLQHDELLENCKIQRIKSIEFIGNKEIYNLNVSDNHNYICGMFITGNTGGDMEKVGSSRRLFENPEIYQCLSFDDTFENTGKKIGMFIPAYLGNNDFKDERGITDIDEGLQWYEENRRKLILNHGNSRDIDDEMMNRPIFPSEMFLSKQGNVFPIYELKQCLLNLISNPQRLEAGSKGTLVRCTDCKNGVAFENDIFGTSHYIDSFPIPKEYKKDKKYLQGCVRIWEHPVEDAPRGLYKLGYDTVHYDNVENPESLISVFVYKSNTRFLSSDNSAVYYDMIVAEYTGRHDLLDKNNEIVELLSRYYYSAEIMMEVNIGVNVEYFKRRGIFHLLAGQPAEVLDKHIKSRSQNSIVGYIKSPELVPFLEQSTKEWLQKERGLGSDGKMVTNMQMINSKPLLEELIAYNREDNFDRINALFAIMLAYKQDNLDLEENVYNEENKFLKSINDRIKVLKKGTNRATYSQT